MTYSTFIGIDGGATTCRIALSHRGARTDIELPGANASTDFDGAVAVLRDGLLQLEGAAGLAPDALRRAPCFIGLAGIMDRAMADAVARALPLEHVQVEDDRRCALEGALGVADGCVIALGTGSFFGRRSGGATRLIGGWGLVLGDIASGAYLGRGLLARVLEVSDGLHPPSPLSEALLADFSTPAEIVAFAAQANPKDFARYAPRIMEAAQNGDATARALVQHSAQEVSRMLTGLGWQEGEPVVALGGLAPHYAPYLGFDLQAPAGTALDGALALATRKDLTHG